MLSRWSLLAATGALLAALGGCALNTFNLALIGLTARQETFLPGTLDVALAATTRAMTNMELRFSISKRETDRVVFTGATRRGNRFTLTLRRNVLEQGENTWIEIVWEKESDDQFWLDLLEVTGRVQLPTGGS